MMNPVLVAATGLLFGICAFDMMGILVRMLGGTYPVGIGGNSSVLFL